MSPLALGGGYKRKGLLKSSATAGRAIELREKEGAGRGWE